VSINVLALIGFITAITGTGCGIISLILSIIGLNQINREPNRYNGKGLAIAGIVISAGCIIYFFQVVYSLRHEDF
jgi:ABC-type Fe3+ transport system permease subunit